MCHNLSILSFLKRRKNGEGCWFCNFFLLFLGSASHMLFLFRKAFRYNHISIKDVFKNIVTPPFYFNQLPTQVPKSPYLFQGLKSADFFWIGFHRVVCLKKAQHNKVVCLGPVWNFNFEISNYIIFQTFGLLGHDMKRCVLPFIGQPTHNRLVGKLPC